MPLSAADALDVRRFAGYPLAASLIYQGLDVQGASASLDAILTALDDPSTAVLQGLLTNLRLIEADLPAMRDGLDLKRAAVYERNPAEFAEREGLFLLMRRRLCAFIGVAPGPGLFAEQVAAAGSAGPGSAGIGVVPAVFTV